MTLIAFCRRGLKGVVVRVGLEYDSVELLEL